ncbi:TPA: pilin N-terminal domain-containing protein [Streptococcus suis]|uniref:pilin N-terminal domain-containing protein n=1 Tax=Streptococcus suis TaxID=1307 RepID=UPI0003F999E8|nr:pilin N-terminal domain-containing protein [Streptococcus suis]MBY4955824.1 isopeptide-forming domain-containing fimbrial protein [Streptococcus suis]MBY4970043.1 isopeptide-forming domain-containing fimbrial protein [Streptococcus suis]MBY4981651.1 isopeptide-forming domain-containing fimbrial protein [Streptococcus suis]MBY4992270.1 isopeptide-forming domain-containing fimbrial protein [Streptococcus suis]MBY5007757.1 isopeptide-forming domain-containing fimbrial protein [Streptococcus su
MKKLTKLFSLLTVLLTMFGPLGNLRHLVHANDAQPHKTAVVVHKVLMTPEQLENFNHDQKQVTNKYVGNQIQNFGEYFGEGSKEIGGVNFKVWTKVDRAEDGVTKTGIELGIAEDNNNYKLNQSYPDGVVTLADSQGATFELEDGTHIFVEDKENSPYYNKDGVTTEKDASKELTQSKAVPFKLELPVTKPDGQGYFDLQTKLHVYPKNTEDKPDVKKTFGDGNTGVKEYDVGTKIPYKITTRIPKGSTYRTLIWDDLMVNGLDFDVTTGVQIVSKEVPGFNDEHYSVEKDIRGFVLKVNQKGLNLIEETAKTQDVNFTLTYNGVLNTSAQINTQIPNKVTFHFGNRPRNFNDEKPKPVTPNGDNKIRVNKNWSTSKNKKEITFFVYEKETGTKVGEFKMTADEQSKEYSEGLKPGTEYIVVEQPVDGHIPSYTVEQGDDKKHILSVTNNPSDNPPPVVPEEPKVITYGKRFVKTNDVDLQQSEKLQGAKFVVKNTENKYLVLDSTAKDVTAVWVDSKETATQFESKENGQFEVKGLKAGRYYLEEIKAPNGYALLSNAVEFEVSPTSWGDSEVLSETNFLQIRNKKVTIPQTGGIGTLVFTVVGLSVMAFAYIAMKKRQAEDA